MGRIFALIACLTLTGCVRTVYVPKPVEVKVPVPVFCLSAEQIPSKPNYAYMNIYETTAVPLAVRAMRVGLMQHRAYEENLLELLIACTSQEN